MKNKQRGVTIALNIIYQQTNRLMDKVFYDYASEQKSFSSQIALSTI